MSPYQELNAQLNNMPIGSSLILDVAGLLVKVRRDDIDDYTYYHLVRGDWKKQPKYKRKEESSICES